MLKNPLPLRSNQLQRLLEIVAQGDCCALYGLSNSGKSPLLRALSTPDSQARLAAAAGQPGALVYIDCNRAVELTSQGFYEIVLRCLLEALEDLPAEPDLLRRLHEQHHSLTSAASAFHASLAFNIALAETCASLGRRVVLLFDEFDEVYAGLENRALLNLRALKDKFGARLAYLTATIRPLSEGREAGDNEFAELFIPNQTAIEPLSPADARQVVNAQAGGRLTPEAVDEIVRLAGGHFGLIGALTQAALRGGPARLGADPNVRGECLKIWNQLRLDEQQALHSLAADAQAGLAAPARERLRALGLLDNHGAPFSDLFTAFIQRQTAAPPSSGLRVDDDAGEVWVDGVKITVLTDLEYRLMRLLYERLDRLTTKDMIVTAVWGGEYFDRVDDARIEKLVSRLRSKVEPDPVQPRYLLTQRGRGYKLASRPANNNDEAGDGR